MRLTARYAARSDIGLNRQTNEDAWLVRPPLFAVADGMGGAQAGEVASRVALQTLSAAADRIDPRDRAAAGETLAAAAHEANRRVWDLSTEYAAQAGMGTTLTALALCTDGARLVHIGDSRAYLWRDGALTQLTADHSLVAEMVRSGELTADQAHTHPLRSVLSRALGTEPEPGIDALDVALLPGDRLLLCTDGLTGPVPDGRIGELLQSDDPERAAAGLVSAALDAGGPDNVTVVVLYLEAAPPAADATAPAEHGATAADDGAAPGTDGAAPGMDAVPATQSAAPAADAVPATQSAAPAADAAPPLVDDGRVEVGGDEARSALRSPVAASAAPKKDAARRPARRRWLLRLAVVVIVVVVLAAGVLVLGQLEWVGVDDQGFVTVYRGVPWSFAGLRLYRVHERVLTLRYEALPAAGRRAVDAGGLGWRGSGERLVERLREAP